MRRIILCLSIVIVCSLSVHAQIYRKARKDFKNLETFSENGDYKAGLFYSKKMEGFVTKKAGPNSPEALLLLCYKAHFLNQLDFKKEYKELLPEIENRLRQVVIDTNTASLLEVYKQYSRMNYSDGIFTRNDSLYALLKVRKSKLLPFEREQLEYYKLYSDYRKGFLNEATVSCSQHFNYLLSHLTEDSVYKKKVIVFTKLTNEQKKERYLLASRFFSTQLKAMLENGLTDSVLAKIEKHEKELKKGLSAQKGFLSELNYIKGLCYLKQDEFKKAEREFHLASVLARDFYLEHSISLTNIQHSLITSQLAQNKNEEAEYYNNDVSVKVVGYYGKHSLAYQHNNYTDIEVLLLDHQWTLAENELIDFLSSKYLPELHEYRSVALNDLSQVYLKTHQYSKVDSVTKVLLDLQTKLYGEKSPVLNRTKLKQAVLYSNYLDRFTESKAIFNSILTDSYLDHISISNPEYISAITAQSKLFEYLEDYTKAFQILNKGLEQSKTTFGETSEQYAKILNPLAALEINSGQYEGAGKDINTSLLIFNNKNTKSPIRYLAEALEIKARLKIIEGEYKQADSLLREATIAYSKISRLSTDDLFSIEEIGLLYIHTGKYNKAEKYLKRILAEREAGLGVNHKSSYNILNYLGELNVVMGNYSDADRYFERSTAITKRVFGEKSIPYANSLVYQKKLYAVLGDAEKSTKILKTAIDIYKKAYGEDNIKVGNLLHEYALSAMELNLQQSAGMKGKAELENILAKSFTIIKNKLSAESPAYGNALEDAALFYVYANEPKKALGYLTQAKEIWSKKLGDHNIYTARLEMLAGKIYYKMESFGEALNKFEKSKSIYESVFDNNHPLYIEALGKSAQLYYILGQKNKAVESIEYCVDRSRNYLKTVFPLLSEKGKSAYWEKIKEDFEFYKTLTFASDNIKDEMVAKVMDMQIQTRAILLNSQLKIKEKIISSGDTLLIRLYQELLTNRENLALAYSMTTAEKKEAGLDIGILEAQNEKLEKQLSEKSQIFSGSKEKIVEQNWKTLKKVLKPDEVVLEITPFRLFTKKFTDTIWYAVLSVDESSGKPGYVVLKNGKELQTKFLKYYRNSIKFNVEDELSFTNFWQPILPLIKPIHKNIYLVRDGVYNQINPETIKDGNGSYLLNSTRIHNLCTSRDLFNRNVGKEKVNGKVASEIDFFGNPIYYTADYKGQNSVPQLPGSEIEVIKIDSLMSFNKWITYIYTQDKASEEKVKSVNNPKVLHISTHGFFVEEKKRTGDELRELAADNPLLRSGLLMKEGGNLLSFSDFNTINKSDGILTAYEVLNLSLDKTDLVVLSACETGLGEVKIGEGVLGLQRSFQVAGAQTVIMSMFKVSDEVTQKLMLKFYNNWLTTGNKFDSFIQAKKEIMTTYSEPKYWGAFVMVGTE